MKPRIATALLGVLNLFAFFTTTLASNSSNSDRYITYEGTSGDTVYLLDDRKPALYTGNFGDCLGGSLINVTRFDAAYYRDNMTVLFHLTGSTQLANDSLMMYIGVYAYGESRFDLTFNPCNANIDSLCPLNRSVPIEASGIIPISEEDVVNIPSIALSIPDFEGEAILRIFANSTESEIGCYSAVVTNGGTFSHPESVGSVLGIFTFVALVASFATAAYGEAVPTMRLHYAHSLSVGVVFAVFQHIFYTGALSMNWPSVLVAWWSNFAWAGGMIYSKSMQNSIDGLIGNNIGNTSQVGAAGAGSYQDGLGGGYDITQIYKRALSSGIKRLSNHPLMRDISRHIYGRTPGVVLERDLVQRSAEHMVQSRALANSTNGYKWYGHPVGEGLPLPGNYSGFAGTLAQEGIRVSNAFMTGFLWFLILLVLLVATLMAFKWALEGFARLKWLKEGRFQYFRDHWLGYSAQLALRICYLAWFMIMFLTLFEFTYQSSGGVKAVAAIVFIIFLIGIPGLAIAACLYKKKLEESGGEKPGLHLERKKLLGKIPWFGTKKSATGEGQHNQPPASKSSLKPFWKRTSTADTVGSITDQNGNLHSIHDNEDYTTKFGWLAARFRRTRWWFFTAWLFYEFLRAIFYAGASGYPLAQVFGLLVIEVLGFAFIIWARPFEGRRLNVLVVYCLGFSKVASVALSAAFVTQFNLDRIITTVIGVVIIVIQGILTILTMIAIIVGAISSYMSVSRNCEDFRPRKWANLREKYFNHLDKVVNDLPPEPKPVVVPVAEEPKEPYFEMKSMRRLPKVEDEDEEFASEMRAQDPAASYVSLDEHTATPKRATSIRSEVIRSGAATPVGGRRSRANSTYSVSQTQLPFGARSHRPSWSTRDFAEANDRSLTPVDMTRVVADDEPIEPAAPGKHSRTPSRSNTLPNPKVRPQISSDQLQVGGEVSTRDTIGTVPAPAMRPRAGTFGSKRNSRSNTPVPFENNEASSSNDWLGELSYNQTGGQRASAKHMLTPAQEQEEFDLRRRPSQGQ